MSGGSGDESGAGAVWWLMFIYYISLGIPIFIVSIVFAALGINSKRKVLAIISLVITVMPAVLMILLSLISTILFSAINLNTNMMTKEYYKTNNIIMMSEY